MKLSDVLYSTQVVSDAKEVRVPEESPPRWMTVQEVAELFRVNEETVRRWIRGGDLAVLDLGGKAGYRIAHEDLEKFIAARHGPAGKDAA